MQSGLETVYASCLMYSVNFLQAQPVPRLFSAASSPQALLAYDEVTSPFADLEDDQLQTVCMVHGLLGLGRNWRTLCRQLAALAARETSRCVSMPFPTGFCVNV